MGTRGSMLSPKIILKMPEDFILPLLCALALTLAFAGLLVHLWWLAGAAAIAGLALRSHGCGRARKSGSWRSKHH